MRGMFSKTAVAACLCAGAILAQTQSTPPSPPDPAEIAAHRVKFLKTVLSLTDAQAAQATTIFTNAATASESLRGELTTAHTALKDAVKANNTAAIDQAATTVGGLTGQLIGMQSKADAAFYALLTAEQKTKFDQLGPMGGGGRGPHGSGMGGPGGPPPHM